MFNKLFGDVGGKLKLLATITFYLYWIGGTITGVVLLVMDDYFLAYALLLIALSWLVAWLMSLPLYAFGQLVQNSDAIREKMGASAVDSTASVGPVDSQMAKEAAVRATKEAQLKAWREQDLITEEEYQAKLKEL